MQRALRHGVFTLSLDFELVWGSRDLVTDIESLEREALITRNQVFDALLGMLTARGIRATWATVGHLFLAGAARGDRALHPEVVPPRHAWRRAPWFEGVPAGTEQTHPAWYARSLVEQLIEAQQDVGCHSFSHAIFGDPGCTRETAASELQRCVALARELGVSLKSFVFPRNVPGHVDLLAEHGFTCWRPPEPAWFQHPSIPGSVARLAHFAEVGMGRAPPTVVPVRDRHGLWQIPGSSTFLPAHGIRRAIPMRQRTKRAVAGIDRAVVERRISHLYVHPINFAEAPHVMLRSLEAILDAAVARRDAGELSILSMDQIAEQCENGILFASPTAPSAVQTA